MTGLPTICSCFTPEDRAAENWTWQSKFFVICEASGSMSCIRRIPSAPISSNIFAALAAWWKRSGRCRIAGRKAPFRTPEKIDACEGIRPESSLTSLGGQPADPYQYTAEELKIRARVRDATFRFDSKEERTL